MAVKQGYLGAFYAQIQKLIDNCDVNWANGTHGVAELDTDDKKEGNASVKITGTSVVAGDILATHDFTSMDLTSQKRVKMWIKSSKTTAAGDLQLLIDETAACGGSPCEEEINIPILTADTWTLVELALAAPADLNAVISVGIKYAANAQNSVIHVDKIKADSITEVTNENVGTGNGSTKEFDLDYANVDLDTLAVKLAGIVTRDYSVTVKGHIVFVTAPGNDVAITADYEYWQVEQKGGFYNWSLPMTGDVSEVTDFSSAGWKEFIGLLKSWTGSAEQFWLNESWTDELGNLLIIKFYEDTGAALQRYEGWGILTGASVNTSVSTLITSPLSFQGKGVLSYESG